MNTHHCANCGVQIGKLALWTETTLYHVLIPASEGPGCVLDAALITNAPDDVIRQVMRDTSNTLVNRCIEIESMLHALGHFAVIAKWEGRFLL